MTDAPERVDFFFDPMCPWCWITSRWVQEVREHRPLEVDWRFISLAVLNEDKADDLPPNYLEIAGIGRGLHRVAAAVRDKEGNEAVGRLYTEYGLQLHNGGLSRKIWTGDAPGDLDVVGTALAAAGLPAAFAEQAHEPDRDELLRAETELALERTGPDVGTPIITFDLERPNETSLFGPVIRYIPRGEDAVRLWDAVGTVARSGVAELKRTARGEIVFD
jgi:hypothetical protein